MAATRTDKKVLEQLIIRPPLREKPLKRLPILHNARMAKVFLIATLILGTACWVALFLLPLRLGDIGTYSAAILGLLALSCGLVALYYL